MKFGFTACNENSSLQSKCPELKLRDSDAQRPQLYFELHFLTATALFLKAPLALIKKFNLITLVNILKLLCTYFSVRIINTGSTQY